MENIFNLFSCGKEIKLVLYSKYVANIYTTQKVKQNPVVKVQVGESVSIQHGVVMCCCLFRMPYPPQRLLL